MQSMQAMQSKQAMQTMQGIQATQAITGMQAMQATHAMQAMQAMQAESRTQTLTLQALAEGVTQTSKEVKVNFGKLEGKLKSLKDKTTDWRSWSFKTFTTRLSSGRLLNCKPVAVWKLSTITSLSRT